MKHSVELIPTIFTTYNFHILRICFDLLTLWGVCVGGVGGGAGGATKILSFEQDMGNVTSLFQDPIVHLMATHRDAANLPDPALSLAITNSVQYFMFGSKRLFTLS